MSVLVYECSSIGVIILVYPPPLLFTTVSLTFNLQAALNVGIFDWELNFDWKMLDQVDDDYAMPLLLLVVVVFRCCVIDESELCHSRKNRKQSKLIPYCL